MSDTSQPLTPPTYVPQPLPVEDWPSFDHIQTEDGAPVDGVFSEKQMRLLTESLYSSWQPSMPYVALANVGLFYNIDLAPIVPDVLLSINVRMPENLFPKLNRSYFVWKYGKPPEVVIEIVSNREGGEDTRKVEIYSEIRVLNYVIYDPEKHLTEDPFRVFRFQEGRLKESQQDSGFFEQVGLGLTVWHGRYEGTDSTWLRWIDEKGILIPTGAEQAAMAEHERTRAENEHTRAEQEYSRAEQERTRAEELAAENDRLKKLLRDQGIE